MKVKTISSAWMLHDGRRFDCGPYMSGALEAKILLEEMSCEKVALRNLTAGHDGGIYNRPTSLGRLSTARSTAFRSLEAVRCSKPT